ncbi:putative harbinger transposase-derived protein [Helianthus anomalus]
MAGCEWPNQTSRWGLFKKNSFINTLPYLSFFSHNIKHIKHNLAMSSSSYTESSSSSDDDAGIFLQTIVTVVKVIVEDEEEEEETQQPKRRRRYIARERHTANNLLVSDYFSAEPKYDEKIFRHRFRMSRNLFLRISRDLEEKYVYFKGTFFVNMVEYVYGYYLVDGIYPEWGVFVKSFTKHGTTDPKRLKFNRVQMAARKDVERAFGVLKKRWRILAMPCRLWDKDQIGNVMYTCIILHNMILEDEGRATVTYYDDDGPQPGNVCHTPTDGGNIGMRRSVYRLLKTS